jgi:hypothetical protein
MNFEVKDKIAIYKPVREVDAADVALAIFSAHEAAKSESIEQFIVAIPNTQFTVISEIARLVGCRGIVQQNGSDGVTLTYNFQRTVIVTMTGAPTLLQTTPEPIDLAHRSVLRAQANNIESV